MRNKPRFVNEWRIFSLALLFVSAGLTMAGKREGNSAASMNTAQARTRAVVFAVSAESGEGSMDAVVIVDGKRLRAPYTDEQKDKQKNFGNQYFASGKVYRLIFGGGASGTITVKKWSEGCNNIHAEVTTATRAPLGGR